MVELATLQAVSYIMGSLGVFVAAVYYVLNIQNNRKNQELSLKAQEQQLETRQTQLFMQIYSRIDVDISKAYYTVMRWEWNDFDDFMEKYGEFKNNEVWTENATRIANYFTGIGVLVKRNMLDPELADELFGQVLVKIWEKMAPIILEYRVRYSSDKWSPIEYLYTVLKPFRDKRLEQILSPKP